MMSLMAVLLLLLQPAAAGAAADARQMSLRDHPIAASAAPVYLDGAAWTASTLPPPGADARQQQQQQRLPPPPRINMTVAASVPGDLITDLQRAAVIADPWLDTTWIGQASLWSDHAWTYTTHFAVSEAAAVAAKGTGQATAATALLLVLDGVKMGATVRVNGHTVGLVRDQFLRYVFTLDPAELGLVAGQNRLDVTFGVGDVAEDGRFMACTGGWDWAPYSYTSTNSSGETSGPAVTFSKGIWKSVYLVEVPAATLAITHVTPHTHYMGAYPTARLADGEHGGFAVNVTAHLWAPSGGATGMLSVAGSWTASGDGGGESSGAGVASSSELLTLPAGSSKVSLQLTATANQIKLWWPSGVGAQPLYNVTATWAPAEAAAAAAAAAVAGGGGGGATVTATRRIGFRVFALVTVNDTNTTIVASNASKQVTGQANDTGTHGMFFRVNGAPIYSRGANMIPM